MRHRPILGEPIPDKRALERCPVCEAERPHVLADGRVQCRTCRKKFSRTHPGSVWASFRLSPLELQRLSQMVAKGIPPSGPEVRDLCSAPTRVRFARLARACFARAIRLRTPFESPVECDGEDHYDRWHWGRLQGARRRAIVLRVEGKNGKVKALPERANRSMAIWREMAAGVPPGAPHYVSDSRAYVWLPVRGERVIVPKTRGRLDRFAPSVDTQNPDDWSQRTRQRETIDPRLLISRFCRYLDRRLAHVATIPLADFHLYLYETCYRFNVRHAKLYRDLLVMNLMRRFSLSEIERDWFR